MLTQALSTGLHRGMDAFFSTAQCDRHTNDVHAQAATADLGEG